MTTAEVKRRKKEALQAKARRQAKKQKTGDRIANLRENHGAEQQEPDDDGTMNPRPPGSLTGKAVLYNDEWLSPVGPKPRPLWVLPPGAHDGPEGTYMVNWQERGGGTSQQYVDEDDVRDCPLVARAEAGQDVDADGPQDLQPLNQVLGLLVEVKKERDEVKKERDDHESRGELLDSMVNPLEKQRRELQTLVSAAKKALLEHGIPTRTMKDADAPFYYSDASYEDEQEVPWHAAFERPMTLEECVDWVVASRQDAGDGRVEASLRKTIKELEGALKKRDATIQRRDKTVADLRKRVSELEKDKKKMKEDQKKMKEDQSTLRKRVAELEKDQAEAERRAKTKLLPVKRKVAEAAEKAGLIRGPPPKKSKAQQKRDVHDCPFSKLTLQVPGAVRYVVSQNPECNRCYKVDQRDLHILRIWAHVYRDGPDWSLRFGPSILTKTSWAMDDMESDNDWYHGPFPLNGELDGEREAGWFTYDEVRTEYYRVKGKPGKEFKFTARTPRRDCSVVFAAKANGKELDSFSVKFVSAEVELGDKASCERFVTEIEDSMD